LVVDYTTRRWDELGKEDLKTAAIYSTQTRNVGFNCAGFCAAQISIH
jgi:hypothetical protein